MDIGELQVSSNFSRILSHKDLITFPQGSIAAIVAMRLSIPSTCMEGKRSILLAPLLGETLSGKKPWI